jgi:hypothetical protein
MDLGELNVPRRIVLEWLFNKWLMEGSEQREGALCNAL